MKIIKYYFFIWILIVASLNLVYVSCKKENTGKNNNSSKVLPTSSTAKLNNSPQASPTPSTHKVDNNNIEKYVNQEFIDAVSNNNIELVTKFLKAGIDPNIKDGNEFSRRSGLHYAAEVSNIDMMKLLLKYGADINVKGLGSLRPIHVAIMSNQLKAVEFLIDSGADINAVDIQDRTPLFYAADFKNYEIAEYLLKKGADCTINSFTGNGPPGGKIESVYDMAKENQDEQMIKLLDNFCRKKTK